VVVAVGLSLAACSSSDSADGDAARPDASVTVPPSTTSSSTAAEPADPFAIPDDPADIDEAYVQRVVDALYAVDAAAAEQILAARAVTPQATQLLSSIFVGEELDLQSKGWSDLLSRPGSVETFRPGRHSLRHRVEEIVGRSDSCLFVRAIRSYEDVSLEPPEDQEVFLALRGVAADEDPSDLNPTPWVLFTAGVQLDPAVPPGDPCDT
jgi:hypothetical protein